MVGDANTTALVTFAVVFAFVLLLADPARWLAAGRADQPPKRGPLFKLLLLVLVIEVVRLMVTLAA